jgi:hypothetical protein
MAKSKSRFNVDRGEQRPLAATAARQMSQQAAKEVGPVWERSQAHRAAGQKNRKPPKDPLAAQILSHFTPSGRLRRRG